MIIIEAIIFAYFAAVTLYTLILAVAGRFPHYPYNPVSEKVNRIAVLIPSYKEDEVIFSTAVSALEQDYPRDRFSVVVIADTLKEDTLDKLNLLPIELVVVDFEQSTKVKSLNKGMKTIGDDYDIALILDADNVMEAGFLRKINDAFNSGYNAIQGRRIAKNMNTPFAVLDSYSEMVNNHVYRKGQVVLGLSSAVIGSGMAFDYATFKEVLVGVHAVGGFDRVVELAFIEKGEKIAYLDDAIVYDEKIQTPVHFQNQRRRWLSSQFVYLRENFWKGVKSLFRGNVDYFNLSIVHSLTFPRVLNLGFLTGFTALAYLLGSYAAISPVAWLALTAVFCFTILISIPIRNYNLKLVKSLLYLPQAFFLMFVSLFKLKGANRRFIHTPHHNVEIDRSFVNKS